MQGALYHCLHPGCKRRHHQAGADAASEHACTQSHGALGLADQREAAGAENAGQHRRVTGAESIGGDRRDQRGQHETDQRERPDDTDHRGRQFQLVANGRHEQPESETREPIADRDQRCTERREPGA